MNSIKITLISFVMAGTAVAAETVKFVSLDACKTYYSKTGSPVASQTINVYCADKIMSALEACSATKIAEYVKANKLKAFSDLIDREQITLKTKFSYQCQVASQNEAAGNAKVVADQRRATSNGSSSGGGSAQSAAQTVAAVAAVTPLVTTLADDIEKIQKGTAAQPTATASGTKPEAATSAQKPAEAPSAQQPAASTASQTAQQSAVATPAAEQPAATVKATTATAAPSEPAPAPVDAKATATETAVARDATPAAAEEVKQALPETKDAVAELSNTTAKVTENTAPPEPTAITESAKTTSETMMTKIDGINDNVQTQSMGTDVQYASTATAFTTFRAEAFKYTGATKNTCANLAEKASFLCIESTSPHAIIAKKVMDSAGPILGAANSAIKACSSTAKVTRLVGLGLTVAKGVCVAAKVACDVSCGMAVKDLATLQASIQSKIGAAINADWATNNGMCMAKYPVVVVANIPLLEKCQLENERTKLAMIAQGKALIVPLQTENVPATVGTSPGIAKSCIANGKDIALFAMQALGAFAAQKNAKACEEKLAASGSAGANVTTQQYCEKSENVNTQLCVCQKNPMAKDCPGAVVADSSAAGKDSVERGVNIKGGGGNSAFAGGLAAAGSKANLGNPTLSKDSVAGALAADGTKAANGGAFGGGDGGGASSSGGGLGSASSPSEQAALKKEAEEKKKWNFGAFKSDSAIGALGGFGSGGSGKNGKSGALTTRDQVAIQRQIASEKYAAEVSTASGKSNWEKVRNMYLIKENSFMFGQ